MVHEVDRPRRARGRYRAFPTCLERHGVHRNVRRRDELRLFRGGAQRSDRENVVDV